MSTAIRVAVSAAANGAAKNTLSSTSTIGRTFGKQNTGRIRRRIDRVFSSSTIHTISSSSSSLSALVDDFANSTYYAGTAITSQDNSIKGSSSEPQLALAYAYDINPDDFIDEQRKTGGGSGGGRHRCPKVCIVIRIF
jgi:hypothetical protein